MTCARPEAAAMVACLPGVGLQVREGAYEARGEGLRGAVVAVRDVGL